MENKRIIYALFCVVVFLGFFLSALPLVEKNDPTVFESEINKNSNPASSPEKTKNDEDIFSQQNYLLPLEKALIPVKKDGAEEIGLTAKSILVIDSGSGKIIFEKDADKKLPIASLTKLATAFTILEQSDKNIYRDQKSAKNKIYNLDKDVTISKAAIEQEGDSSSLKEGEIIKARDLLAAMLIASSNDAAWALAEDVGRNSKDGGETGDFIGLMNDMANKEKLSATHFSNPTGIDDDENYSSASDVLHVAQKLMRYYPETFVLTKTMKMDIASADGKEIHHLENTDKLLGKMPGIIGGKTGFTDEAGEALVLIVKNNINGATISAALIGSKDRFGEMEKLINWVWVNYEWK